MYNSMKFYFSPAGRKFAAVILMISTSLLTRSFWATALAGPLAFFFPHIGVPLSIFTSIYAMVRLLLNWNWLRGIVFVIGTIFLLFFYLPSAIKFSVIAIGAGAMQIYFLVRSFFFVGYKRRYLTEAKRFLRRCKNRFSRSLLRRIRLYCPRFILQNKRLHYFEPEEGIYVLLMEITAFLKNTTDDEELYAEIESFEEYLDQCENNRTPPQAEQKKATERAGIYSPQSIDVSNPDVVQATERFNRALQAAGIPNPYTGKTFQSVEELEDYKRRFDEAQQPEPTPPPSQHSDRRLVEDEDGRFVWKTVPSPKNEPPCSERQKTPLASLQQQFDDICAQIANNYSMDERRYALDIAKEYISTSQPLNFRIQTLVDLYKKKLLLKEQIEFSEAELYSPKEPVPHTTPTSNTNPTYLMETWDGMMVWIPEDKLDAFEANQARLAQQAAEKVAASAPPSATQSNE